MRFLKHLFAALSISTIGLLATSVQASPADPKNGVDYRTLDKPQQTESGKKVEVLEFFWYSCPHCHAFDPELTAWVKKQGDNIVFKRVPVAFRDTMIPQQKLFYTLEAMGKLDEMHSKVFNAIHVQRERLDTDAQILDFMVKNGIDKQKFLDVYNSFSVQTKVKRASQVMPSYGIDGVPTLAVDGRYITSPSIVGAGMGGGKPEPVLHASTLQVMDWLVAKAKQGK